MINNISPWVLQLYFLMGFNAAFIVIQLIQSLQYPDNFE